MKARDGNSKGNPGLLKVFIGMVFRGMRQRPLVALFISLSVALTVAVSIVATSAVNIGAHNLGKRALDPGFPFHGLVVFWNSHDLDSFQAKKDIWKESVTVYEFPVVKGQSQCGALVIAGIDGSLPEGVIRLEGEVAWPGHVIEVRLKGPGAKPLICTWKVAAGDLGQGRPGHEMPADGTGDMVISQIGIPGWGVVNPESLRHFCEDGTELAAGAGMGVLFAGAISPTEAGTGKLLRDIEYLRYEFPGCTVITGDSGRRMLEKAARTALAPWQVCSFLVLLAASVGVSCVLTASFLGRKRALGILKVLGATHRDYTHLMLVEGMCLGGPGILLGFPLGFWASHLGFGRVMAGTGGLLVAAVVGLLTVLLGVYLPLRLVRNATCDQLLNNKPVYAMSNPSCAQCGLCGGF